MDSSSSAADQQQMLISQLLQQFAHLSSAPPQFQQQQQITILPEFESFSPSDQGSGKFSRWFSRFQHFTALHCANWDEPRRITLLMTKLNATAYEQFEISLKPGKIGDINSFDECVQKLRELFDAKRTLVSDRYEALQVQIKEGEDIRTLGNRVRKMVAEFDFANFTEDHLKSLLFIQALKPKKYANVRMRLLQSLQNEPAKKLEDLIADCTLYLDTLNLSTSAGEQKQQQQQNKKAARQSQQQQQQVLPSAPLAPAPPPPVTVVVNQQQQQRQQHNQPRVLQTGRPPAHYICHICQAKGEHFIGQCPRRNTGGGGGGGQSQQQQFAPQQQQQPPFNAARTVKKEKGAKKN